MIYTGIGFGTFILDFTLLFVLTDLLHVQYLLSAGIAFVTALTAHFLLVRRAAFAHSTRPLHVGYLLFFSIGAVGLGLVTALLYVCVEVLGMHYLFSRFLVACIVSMWGYIMNSRITFR